MCRVIGYRVMNPGIVVWMFVLLTVSFSLGSSVEKNPHHLFKREVQCMEKYAKITPGHTACLPSSGKGVSNEDKTVILDKHNAARREVSPTAKRMFKLSWDSEIAKTAQSWAENCVTDHDENYKRYAFGKYSVGQNIAYGTSLTWAQAIDLWVDERDIFTFGGSNTGKMVGHYTQIVWDKTLTVGCGYAQCPITLQNRPYTNHYYVCNYGPAGNSNGGNTPYETGASCGDCPAKCSNKLCDCSGKVCYNGGTLDPNTCECKCKASFHMQPSCDLNCTDIQDISYCSSWTKGHCEMYSNVPQECPKLCDWCPTAGYGYGKETGGVEGHVIQHISKLVMSVAMGLGCYWISKH